MQAELHNVLPKVRGKLIADVPLAPYNWFRIGGKADVLFLPADIQDLQAFLKNTPDSIPITILGLGSNVLIRDGGIAGVVIRLSGKGFGQIDQMENHQIGVGAAVPDLKLAQMAAKLGMSGLEFFSGIPGSIGGALRMNAGCYGTETKDVLVKALVVTRKGEMVWLKPQDLGYSYRHCSAPEDLIFVSAVFQCGIAEPAKLLTQIDRLRAQRENTQPIREKTGGSTFANPDPPGTPDQRKAWKLIDAAHMRGHQIGNAKVSEKHCNFLINMGNASAADLENLGEHVRAKVLETSQINLRWEIRRMGCNMTK